MITIITILAWVCFGVTSLALYMIKGESKEKEIPFQPNLWVGLLWTFSVFWLFLRYFP